MSRQPSPGPSQQTFHAAAGPTAPPVRTKSKAYSSGIAAGAEDVKYAAKFKDLKRKVKEIETDNDKIYLKILQAKRNIQRAQLERAILYERLSNVPASPPPHSAMLPEGMHEVHEVHDVPRGPLPPQAHVEPIVHHHRRGSSNNVAHADVPFNGNAVPSGLPGGGNERVRHRVEARDHPTVINGLPVVTLDLGPGHGIQRVAVNDRGEPLILPNGNFVTEDILIREQRENERHEQTHGRQGGRHRDRERTRGEGSSQLHLEAPRIASRSRSHSSHPPQALVPSVPVQGLSRRERESLREIERERERGGRVREREREHIDLDRDRDHEIEWERERERVHRHREPGLGHHSHRESRVHRHEHQVQPHHHHQEVSAHVPIGSGGGPSPIPAPMVVPERPSRRHDIHELAGSRPPSLGHSPIPAHAQAGAPGAPGVGMVPERQVQQPPTPVQAQMSPPVSHAHAHGGHGRAHVHHSRTRSGHQHTHSHSHAHGYAHSHSSVSANSSRSPTEARQSGPGAITNNTRIHSHQRVGPGANLNLNREHDGDLDREHEGDVNIDVQQGDAEMDDVDDDQWSGHVSPPSTVRGRAWERGRGDPQGGAAMHEQYGGGSERSPSPSAQR